MRVPLALVGSLLLAPTLLAASAGPRAELRFASGVFRPGAPAPAVPAWFHAASIENSGSGSRYLAAITREALGEQARTQLESLGAEILGYLPVHGYRLRMAPESESAVRRLPFVVWLGALPSHLKIEPELAA